MAITLLAKNPSKLKALQQELDNALGNYNGELHLYIVKLIV